MGSLDEASSPPESLLLPLLKVLVGTREALWRERRRREREREKRVLKCESCAFIYAKYIGVFL